MSAFADSSALVKLYADEDGSEIVRGESALAVCAIARVEVPAALWRKHWTGELAADDAAVLVSEFEADFEGTGTSPPRLATVAITSQLLDSAAALPALHRLRAYDAVQLAAAIAVADADPEFRGFLCFDARLRAAAAAHGVRCLP